MKLLQIQDPKKDAKDAPAERQLAVGIDLGTTNSLIAAAGDDGVKVFADDDGRQIVPSVVHYGGGGEVLVGAAAAAKQLDDPQNTIVSVKRLMGRGVADVGGEYRYDYQPGDGMVKIRTAGGDKSPVQVSADILSHLRRLAEEKSGQPVAGAVITVPAYFDEAQRQATKNAAHLAGLRVFRLLNEPTAAAVAYGLDEAAAGVYAVYDLGGGTFDVSVLRLEKGVFEVLATGGDTALGGDDYDRVLANWAAEKTPQWRTEDKAGFWRLLAAARKAKEELSHSPSVKMALSDDCVVTVSQENFAEATADLTAATIRTAAATLRDAGVRPAQVEKVVLVGGATRMPAVRRAVADFFAQAPTTALDPDKVVAMGAALQADVLAGNRRGGDDWLLLDVIPLSLGLETMGGLAEKIIPRNSTIPIAKSREFTTHQDGQTAMRLHVVQGERELVQDCRSLAQFTLSGLPPLAAGQSRVRVSFQVDADGLLSVTAAETESGVQAGVAVKPAFGLSEEDIAAMISDSHDQAAADRRRRRLAELQHDGDTTLRLTQKALMEDGELLAAAERAAIETAMAELQQALDGGDVAALAAAAKALEEASVTFAERRMNAGVRKILSGKSIDDMA